MQASGSQDGNLDSPAHTCLSLQGHPMMPCPFVGLWFQASLEARLGWRAGCSSFAPQGGLSRGHREKQTGSCRVENWPGLARDSSLSVTPAFEKRGEREEDKEVLCSSRPAHPQAPHESCCNKFSRLGREKKGTFSSLGDLWPEKLGCITPVSVCVCVCVAQGLGPVTDSLDKQPESLPLEAQKQLLPRCHPSLAGGGRGNHKRRCSSTREQLVPSCFGCPDPSLPACLSKALGCEPERDSESGRSRALPSRPPGRSRALPVSLPPEGGPDVATGASGFCFPCCQPRAKHGFSQELHLLLLWV